MVGPNGCGKSNLSDAISWVLGEQSAKSLRGSRMEDVIFAGTRDRKALGMASVTMTLLDPTTKPPAEPQEQPVEVAVMPIEENGSANGHTNGNGNGHGPESRIRHLGKTPSHVTPGEITITRRLFRNGESEYLINGRAARLRDIQDLFMGSGLGPGKLRDHRARSHRTDPQFASLRSSRRDRRSRRHYAFQIAQAPRRSQAGGREAESCPRVRHP